MLMSNKWWSTYTIYTQNNQKQPNIWQFFGKRKKNRTKKQTNTHTEMNVVILVWIRRQYTYAPIRWSWAPVHRTQIVVIEVVLLHPRLPITTSNPRTMNHDHLLHGMSTILGKFVLCIHSDSRVAVLLSSTHTHTHTFNIKHICINFFVYKFFTAFLPRLMSLFRWNCVAFFWTLISFHLFF